MSEDDDDDDADEDDDDDDEDDRDGSRTASPDARRLCEQLVMSELI